MVPTLVGCITLFVILTVTFYLAYRDSWWRAQRKIRRLPEILEKDRVGR